jgi:hypothetical protein
MEIPIVITMLITMASPYLNSFINRVNWSPETKNLVALGTSLLISVAYIYFTGGFVGWAQLGTTLASVYTLQQLTYQFLIKTSATKFEAATTKGAVIVSPAEDPGTVNITTDESIKAGTEPVTAVPPVQITPAPTEIITETPAKG